MPDWRDNCHDNRHIDVDFSMKVIVKGLLPVPDPTEKDWAVGVAFFCRWCGAICRTESGDKIYERPNKAEIKCQCGKRVSISRKAAQDQKTIQKVYQGMKLIGNLIKAHAA